MNTRRALLQIAILLALTVLCLPGWSQTGGKEYTFKYAPQPGVVSVCTITTEKVRQSGGSTKVMKTVGKEKNKAFKTGDGYKIISTIMSFKGSAGGQDRMMAHLEAALVNSSLTLEVDNNGRLLRVMGFDDIMQKTEKAIVKSDPSVAPYFQKVMPTLKTAFLNKMTTEWEGRISGFVGQTATVGDSWAGDFLFELPTGGTASSSMTNRIDSMVKKGSVECLKIVYTSDLDSDAAVAAIQGFLSGMAKSMGVPAPTVKSAELSVRGERIVDPATMNIYSESYVRTTKIIIDDPKAGLTTANEQEKRTYSYIYK